MPAASSPGFMAEVDKVVAQAQAFEPMLAALLTQFVPAAAPFLPEIHAILAALLSAANKASGTTPPATPAVTP